MNEKWRVDKIGRICKTTQGVQIPLSEQKEQYEDGYIRYLYIGDFKSTNKILYVKDDYPQKKVTENDLVMANTGSPGVVFKGINGVLSNNLFKISFEEEIFYRDFLYLYLHSDIFQSVIQSKMKGGIQKHLGHKTISEQNIVIPPLEEQKKIAEILDKASNLISLRKKQIEKLDMLVKAKFVEMFGDIVLNPMRWDKGIIRDVVSEVSYGTSKPAVENGRYTYLRMNNITYDGHLDLSNLKYIDMTNLELSKYTVKKGDILFNRTNSKELVGKTCVFKEDEPMVIAGYIIRVRTNNRVNSEYVSAILNSAYGKKTLYEMCKAIVGQANINAQELQDIKILIPPIKLQNQFAEIVGNIEKQKAQLQQALEKLELNYKALMQQYFG